MPAQHRFNNNNLNKTFIFFTFAFVFNNRITIKHYPCLSLSHLKFLSVSRTV